MANTETIIATSAGIGAIAGLRSMTAPAAVICGFNRGWISAPRQLRFLRGNKALAVAGALAAAELVVDKLPNTPSRTKPVGLAARFATGAASAALLHARRKESIALAALTGGLAAVGAAYAGYQVRRRLGQKLSTPDPVIAPFEDALAITGGILLARAH